MARLMTARAMIHKTTDVVDVVDVRSDVVDVVDVADVVDTVDTVDVRSDVRSSVCHPIRPKSAKVNFPFSYVLSSFITNSKVPQRRNTQ